MKTMITISLLLSATCAMAQQGPQQRRNPRLDSLVNEKDPAALQQRIARLGNGNEEDLGVLLQYYNAKPEAGNADSLFEAIVAKYPRGRYAAIDGRNKIYTGKGGKLQEEMYKAYRQRFPKENFDMILYSVANAYADDKNTKKALEYVDQVKDPGFRNMSVGIIADQLMKYDNKAAEALVKKELDNARALYEKPDPARAGDRLYNPRGNYYRFLNLYGKILMQAKDYAGALKHIGEVYDSTEQKDDELVANYGLLLSRSGKYPEAFPLLDKLVREGKGNAALKKELASAYEKLNPGKKGDAYMAGIQAALREKMREEVAKMLVDEPAPAFEVKDVNGKIVSLADFKGKTIVLDFWATWCGPCKKSFPAMQQAVNKYSGDANVKFLFIHTWERSANPKEDAQDYLSENKFNFDLYMDEKDPATKKNNAVSMFGVRGIPAKFVIDGDGHIRFKVTGFSGGDDAAVEELSAMIEMAKKKVQDQAPKPTVGVGSPAPEMTIDKWLKGKPVNAFEKGKVYVVEFWATWCGPCKLGMPHLSDLANEYKQVSFVGVTVSERTDDPAIPRKFVENAGAMMSYNVAYAQPKGPMCDHWLKAAGRSGIPVAFVVNADGRIGWIGHPLMGLDEAIALAVEGKLTAEASMALVEQWKVKRAKGEEADQALKVALNEGRVDDALRLNDAVVENWPFNIAIASGKKYALLTAKDPKAARAYGEKLLKTHGNAPMVLQSVAATIFDGSDARVRGEVKVKVTGEPDYKLAKKLIIQSLECTAPSRESNLYLERIKELEAKRN